MGDGRAEGRFLLSTIGIEMNPLAIFGGFGELVDTLLGDVEPVGKSNFPAYQLFQGVEILNAFCASITGFCGG